MSDKFLNSTGLTALRNWIIQKLGLKQDTLVSGTNVKTINNESILGSGNLTINSGLQNLVDGSKTGSVRGVGTTAESSTYTMGQYAFTEGLDTTASGYVSHAEGYDTIARGNYSHAQNIDTIASKVAQTTLGRYNIEDTDTSSNYGKYAVIVGNGTDGNNRSNALTVDWGGNTEQQGRATTKDLTPTQIDTIIQELGLHGRTICPYDVGDIYITRNTIDPSEKWEGTTWRQLKDTFLLGAGDTYSAGSTGGASEVTLNTNQIPSHTHPNPSNGQFIINKNQSSGSAFTFAAGSYNRIAASETGAQGGGQAHENMPPYLTVHMWERLT